MIKVSFYFLSILIFFIGCTEEIEITEIQQEQIVLCPPCEIKALQNQINPGTTLWPEFTAGELIKINSLTQLEYELPIMLDGRKAYPPQYWNLEPWWKNIKSDPWSEYPYWGDNYIPPNHNFKKCVNDNLRWMCGYSYSLKVPETYSQDRSYPLIIFLHGSDNLDLGSFIFYEKIRTDFYKPENDPYIYAAPIKLEIDWDPNKIRDLIDNIKKNINIDEKRIYLTGLSMGGRGTFIVASELTETFAAIMPLSPHHKPYSYLSLAENVKEIPIWMSHSDVDLISSYDMAKQMEKRLLDLDANIIFRTEIGVGHSGWDRIYRDPNVINWLLSWKKK